MAGAPSAPSSLKEYLKKYTSNDDEKKKKKKKKKTKPDADGVLVVDEDPIWQKPVQLDDEEESADEDKPQVDEDVEVKRMKRLEALKLKRPYGAISEDGSGWVSVSNTCAGVNSEDQNCDISPPRKSRQRNDSPSPKHEVQPDVLANPDLSLPRKSHRNYQSPPPVVETGVSRLRGARTVRFDTPSPEPHQEASGHEIEADLSPPRRRQREFTEPERISSHSKLKDSDISPPRRASRDSRYRNDSHTSSEPDLSPPRKVKNDRSGPTATKSIHKFEDHRTSDRVASASDLSPPRKRQKESQRLVHQPKTGIVSREDLKDENDKKKKEDWLSLQEMDPSISGRGAEPVYRNNGKHIAKEEFLKFQKKEKMKDEKPKEIHLEWGKGLAQKREVEARWKELEAEKEKPFARSRDDPDLDAMLKDRVRWGDPMAHLVKKKNLETVLPDLGDNERMKESGFIVPQEIPSHSWIRRGVDAPPNRYGIKPGRHWDGVDRSSGYEKDMFKRMNEKSATEREAYLWSVSDM